MSAETLRKAASQIREDRSDDFHLAVADLLDRVADDYAIASHGYWSTCADAVARAYLGSES